MQFKVKHITVTFPIISITCLPNKDNITLYMKLKNGFYFEIFKEKIVLIENNTASFQKKYIHPDTSTKIAIAESNLSVLPPPGQEHVL